MHIQYPLTKQFVANLRKKLFCEIMLKSDVYYTLKYNALNCSTFKTSVYGKPLKGLLMLPLHMLIFYDFFTL